MRMRFEHVHPARVPHEGDEKLRRRGVALGHGLAHHLSVERRERIVEQGPLSGLPALVTGRFTAPVAGTCPGPYQNIGTCWT